LGLTFKGKTFTSFDELRYFTGITSLPDEAFRGCASMVSIYLPENLTSIGDNVFTSCSALKYVAVLGTGVKEASSKSGLPRATYFVDKSMTETYASNELWNKGTFEEFTGIPTVTAVDDSRQYGRTNPKFTYVVSGAPINGVPSLETEAVVTTPVGEWPITVEAGTISTIGLVCVNGVLTIEKAPLTITANSYTRMMGEENPEFEVTYKGFKNKETYEVLNKLPIITCEATADSPAGEYPIIPSGAEADNYEFIYVDGVLTVVAPDGIRDIDDETSAPQDVYNLSGQRVSQSTIKQKGLYIIDKKKVLVR